MFLGICDFFLDFCQCFKPMVELDSGIELFLCYILSYFTPKHHLSMSAWNREMGL